MLFLGKTIFPKNISVTYTLKQYFNKLAVKIFNNAYSYTNSIEQRGMKQKKLEIKKLIIAAVLSILFVPVVAQDWQTNFETTKALAHNQNKTIVLVFMGSDWCAPCMKLEKEIWSSEEFKAYAQNHFIMHKADFPRKKKNKADAEQVKHNKALAEKYNTKGYFPYVALLDKNGKVLGHTGYKKLSPDAYIKHLEEIIAKAKN